MTVRSLVRPHRLMPSMLIVGERLLQRVQRELRVVCGSQQPLLLGGHRQEHDRPLRRAA